MITAIGNIFFLVLRERNKFTSGVHAKSSIYVKTEK